MNTKKIMSIALALFINAGIITACSQTPNTIDPNTTSPANNSSGTNSSTVVAVNPNTGVNGSVIGNSNSVSSPEQNTISSEAQADIQDDETTIQDSETVAQDSNFSTKAKAEVSVDANLKLNKENKGILRPILAKILGKDAREKLLKDSENVLKAKIKLNEAKLKVLKSFNKANTLKRKNINVQNSDTVEIKNDDGTISKITNIKFEGKSETSTRENKVIKTYASDGTTLIKVEHYLTVDGPNFDRTYTKIVNYNTDGSKKVVVKSESKWTDGRSRVVNEERNIDANGNGTGTGTIVLTKKDGTTKTYEINVTITAGTINITPIPAPSPSVSPTAQPTSVPTSEPTVAPTVEPTVAPTADPTTETTVAPTANTLLEVETTTSVETNI